MNYRLVDAFESKPETAYPVDFGDSRYCWTDGEDADVQAIVRHINEHADPEGAPYAVEFEGRAPHAPRFNIVSGGLK